MSLPARILRYGQDAPLPEARTLRAGPLTMLLEEGGLRYVRLGGAEVLRQVYGAVRDRNWNTVPAALSNLRVEAGESSFEASFDVLCRQEDVDFAWSGRLSGSADGTVVFRFDGEARSTFLRNRIGICVLHPVECATRPCRVTHSDGSVEDGLFPRLISPHQPFKDIRAISHPVAAGCDADVRFDGEVFEMEDQRNWTDASFKTYSTPLALPFPVEVKKGTRITQTVTLSLKGRVPKLAPPAEDVVLSMGNPSSYGMYLPGLGLGASGVELTVKQAERLRELKLDHLRVDLDLEDPRWESTLTLAAKEADGAAAKLCVAFRPAPEAELDLLLKRLVELKTTPASFFVLDPKSEEEAWLGWTKFVCGGTSHFGPINLFDGMGTSAYFAELNRGSLMGMGGPGHPVVYSINPQVHGSDLRTVIETLAGQEETILTARERCGQKGVVVGPITLKPRFNPNATAAEKELEGALPATVDVRQMSLVAAGWTVGSLRRLSTHRPRALTYYETVGWRGVMEGDVPRGPLFPSIPGSVFPVYHVFADLAGFTSARPCGTSDPLRAEIFAVEGAGAPRVLAANLTDAPLRVGLTGLERARIRRLNETNAERAMTRPADWRRDEALEAVGTLELLPFEVVRLDVVD